MASIKDRLARKGAKQAKVKYDFWVFNQILVNKILEIESLISEAMRRSVPSARVIRMLETKIFLFYHWLPFLGSEYDRDYFFRRIKPLREEMDRAKAAGDMRAYLELLIDFFSVCLSYAVTRANLLPSISTNVVVGKGIFSRTVALLREMRKEEEEENEV